MKLNKLMNILLVAVLAYPCYGQITQNTMQLNNNAADSCFGIIGINFFVVEKIPFYKEKDAVPFATILFNKKKSASGKEVFYVETNPEMELQPYELSHAENAAAIMERNSNILSSENNWVRTHKKPKSPYKLRFKVIGEYSSDWIQIVTNEKTWETAYIQKDEKYMSYQTWENIIKEARHIVFPDLPVYDKMDGKEIGLKTDLKRGKILSIHGNWLHVNYFCGFESGECWIKWKDEKGMFSERIFIIREFIR